MFRSVVPALAAVAALLVLPSAAAAVVQKDAPADAQALIKLDTEWSKSTATKDADKVCAYYTDDAIAYPPNEPMAVGREAAKKLWATFLAAPDFSLTWKPVHAETSGDLGHTTGTYELSMKVDGKPVSEKGKYVCIWKKQKDGSWKVIHDIWNSDSK